MARYKKYSFLLSFAKWFDYRRCFFVCLERISGETTISRGRRSLRDASREADEAERPGGSTTKSEW